MQLVGHTRLTKQLQAQHALKAPTHRPSIGTHTMALLRRGRCPFSPLVLSSARWYSASGSGTDKYNFNFTFNLFDIPHGNYRAKKKAPVQLQVSMCDVILGSGRVRKNAHCVSGANIVGSFGDPLFRYLAVEVLMDVDDPLPFAAMEMFEEKIFSLYRPPRYEDGAFNSSQMISFDTSRRNIQDNYMTKVRAAIGTWLGFGESSKAARNNLQHDEWLVIRILTK